MIGLVVLTALAGVVLVVMLSRADERAANEWARVRLGPASSALKALEEQYSAERQAADALYGIADRSRAAGDVHEAKRLLANAHLYLSEVAADRRARARTMLLHARLVTAIMPLPPLYPAQFRLFEIRSLSGLGVVLHYILVVAVERFRLRLWILARGFDLVIGELRPESRRQAEARADYGTLEDETLRSARVLVEALLTAHVVASKAQA